MIAHRAVRLACLLCYFAQRQAFKNHPLYGPPLHFIQRTEKLLDQLFQFGNRDARASMSICFPFHDLFEIRPIVELSQDQIISAIDAPVISELQEPHFKSASANVKSSRRTVKFKKNILRNFLSFSRIVENPKCNCEHQAVMPIEERCKGVAIPLLHLTH